MDYIGTFDSIWGNPFSVQQYGREEWIKIYETYVRSNEFLMRDSLAKGQDSEVLV